MYPDEVKACVHVGCGLKGLKMATGINGRQPTLNDDLLNITTVSGPCQSIKDLVQKKKKELMPHVSLHWRTKHNVQSSITVLAWNNNLLSLQCVVSGDEKKRVLHHSRRHAKYNSYYINERPLPTAKPELHLQKKIIALSLVEHERYHPLQATGTNNLIV